MLNYTTLKALSVGCYFSVIRVKHLYQRVIGRITSSTIKEKMFDKINCVEGVRFETGTFVAICSYLLTLDPFLRF